jgi:hypothetical protein
MRRVVLSVLGLAVVAAAVVASVFWFRDHESDGRSDYEKVVAREVAPPAVSFACFPQPQAEGEIADLNANPESDDALVPAGAKRLLLCRYWGMNHGKRSLRLAKSRLVDDPPTARRIADGLNELSPFPDGTFACPFDEGARTYALFEYSDASAVVVELSFEGCPAATNGRADVAWLGDPVARQVKNLVPLPSRDGRAG